MNFKNPVSKQLLFVCELLESKPVEDKFKRESYFTPICGKRELASKDNNLIPRQVSESNYHRIFISFVISITGRSQKANEYRLAQFFINLLFLK